VAPAQISPAHHDSAGGIRQITIGPSFLSNRNTRQQGGGDGGKHQFSVGSHFVYSCFSYGAKWRVKDIH
jgi:hypothetical protein